MGWLADLFSSHRARKGQVITHTNDAFALPTASPLPHTHPDAFNPDTLHTPEPSPSPSVYTYPPQGPASYGYVPTSAGLFRPASGAILPTHMDALHTPLSPQPAYPPLAKTWARIRAWLTREYPELGDTLNYGILPADLAQIEMQFGFALPQVVRESYLVCDGQEAESAAGCSEGLFFGLTLLPLEDVFDEWRFWREVDSDPATGANEKLKELMQSAPTGWVRKEYSQRGWIPLIADKAGNYIGMDLNPAESGQVGQVIVFGRDFDTKVVLWRGDGLTGWAKWLAAFAEELESGEGFELGPAEASDDSEDELGYESYFYDGKGRGQGDGGGDTGGVGGLRLTGEYKGWNVMEAWADRSLRKWHEAGVATDVPLLPSEDAMKGKGTDQKVGLGVMDVHGSGAEIPIPVLADVDEPIPPPTAPAMNGKRASQNIPTISVTKAPAPRPVDLPTVQDIVEEPSTPNSFDEEGGDLEAGRGRGLPPSSQSQSGSKPSSPTSRRPVQPPSISPVPHGIVDPLSDVMSPRADSTTPLVRALSDPADLLADSARPSLEREPVEPSVSESSIIGKLLVESPKLVDAEFVAEGKKEDVRAESDEEEEDEEEEEEEKEEEEEEEKEEEEEEEEEEEKKEEPPENAIRLVGGGGISGAVPLEPQSSEDSETVHVESVTEIQKQQEEADVASVKSVESSSSTKQGTPKKTRSALSGFKRFSGFGGLKKKGSVGSVKSIKEGQQ